MTSFAFGRNAALALGMAFAATVASPAAAVTYNNFDGVTGTYGNDLASPAGTFANSFTFVLGRAGTLTASITSTAANRATNINFSRVRLTGPNGYIQNFAVGSLGTIEFRSLISTIATAGTYTLDVRGTTGGMASYTGNFSFAAVPEPATWGLMILGFGMVGAALRRRSTKVVFA